MSQTLKEPAMNVAVRPANLQDPADQAAIVELLDLYASDPMGQGRPLDSAAKASLPQKLAAFPTCHALLAYIDDTPVGVVIGFLGFSTFNAAPLLNLHDVAVRPGYRGAGIGRKLLAAAEETAIRLGCCKLTLEVHDDNQVAQHLYQAYGFVAGTPRHAFWTKRITP
jgi:ribosomal protein S18 acetylase RimI-like enzyme